MPRPTLSSVARALGVSLMTVSRALRNQPGVSPALRQRVRDTAKEIGYRPDPAIGRLMHHLRHGKEPSALANLCAITDAPENDESAYCVRLRKHAAVRARELGYSFSVFRALPGQGGWPALIRVMESRGVEGVLLLPMVDPVEIPPKPWKSFSVVVATSSIISPRFHEVAPNHAANARLLIEHLAASGFQRLGYVGTTLHSERTRDALPAALAWHHARLGLRCTPLLYSPENPPRLAPWIRRERPDVVIVGHPPDLPRFQAELAGAAPPWALANSRPFCTLAPGLDERADLIGEAAVDLLASLVTRGERGVPRIPISLSISGVWTQPRRPTLG